MLIKDQEWSRRLSRYAALLPGLQRGLPVPERVQARDAGHGQRPERVRRGLLRGRGNAGSKTIAINLPNDEQVQLQKGTRRLQLRNAMRAKFDRILVPIADMLIAPDQRRHVTFDAFFGNTMFHEVAHGLGIKNTINGRGTVREALRDQASALEEGKADVLGLYMQVQLHGDGRAAGRRDGQLRHLPGQHLPLGALRREQRARTGQHRALQLLQGARRLQPRRGDGHLPRGPGAHARRRWTRSPSRSCASRATATTRACRRSWSATGRSTPSCRRDLDRLAGAGIPVDVVFEQGTSVLGL